MEALFRLAEKGARGTEIKAAFRKRTRNAAFQCMEGNIYAN